MEILKNIWFIAYIATVVVAIVIHLVSGLMIKKEIKKIDEKKYDRFIKMHKEYKKENRNFKHLSMYLIFIVPVLNVVVSIIELTNRNNTLEKILKGISKGKLENC